MRRKTDCLSSPREPQDSLGRVELDCCPQNSTVPGQEIKYYINRFNIMFDQEQHFRLRLPRINLSQKNSPARRAHPRLCFLKYSNKYPPGFFLASDQRIKQDHQCSMSVRKSALECTFAGMQKKRGYEVEREVGNEWENLKRKRAGSEVW